MNKTRQQFDLLTAIRGLLALWVVLYHIGFELSFYLPDWTNTLVHSGYLAVDFFFVLSGFVIAYTYQAALMERFDKGTLWQFYLKRVARIYPLHLLILLLYVGYTLLFVIFDRGFPGSERFSIDGFVTSLFLISNWGIIDYLPWNVPAWSISAEMGAYLLFPLLCVLLSKVHNRAATVLAVAVISLTIGLMYQWVGTKNIGDHIAKLGLVRCVGEFALGMVVFQLYQRSQSYSQWPLWLLATIGCVVIGQQLNLLNYWYIPLTMFLFIIGMVSLESSRTIQVPRFWVWLGEISYSVYLSHYLIRDLFKLVLETEQPPIWWFILYVATVILCSHVLYHRVELPAQAWCKAKWLSKKVAPQIS